MPVQIPCTWSHSWLITEWRLLWTTVPATQCRTWNNGYIGQPSQPRSAEHRSMVTLDSRPSHAVQKIQQWLHWTTRKTLQCRTRSNGYIGLLQHIATQYRTCNGFTGQTTRLQVVLLDSLHGCCDYVVQTTQLQQLTLYRLHGCNGYVRQTTWLQWLHWTDYTAAVVTLHRLHG